LEQAKPEQCGFSAKRLERIDAVMQRYVDSGQIAGIATAITRRGQLAQFGLYGMANIAAGTPMQEDTIFRIYSMSKPIISVAALMLFERGALRLSDPVAKYLPAFAEMQVLDDPAKGESVRTAQQTMTIHHLFTHTAGLSYGFDSHFYLDTLYRDQVWGPRGSVPDITLADLIDRVAALPLAEEPGTQFRYSMATDVLGMVVEAASGRPLETFLREEIFEPLGMTDTGFCVPPEKLDRFSANYGPRAGDSAGGESVSPLLADDLWRGKSGGLQVIDAPETSAFAKPHACPSGGGGLVSTTPDYCRFAQMLVNGGTLDGIRLLGCKTVAFMASNHLPDGVSLWGDRSQGFGLGVSVLLDPAKARTLGSVGNFGWGGAANTIFWVDPVEEMTAVLMLQFMPSGTYPVIGDFQTLAYQALDS
jgi:CubicO group peptidase (beta-lactamase class C family)